MTFGSGAISFVNNPTAGALGPLSLQNGLSVVAGKGEMGLNPLLHDTFIERAGFDFRINNATNPNFIINDAGLFMCQIGDINNIQAGINMQMFSLAGAVNQFVIQDTTANFLNIDSFNSLYSLGSNAVGNYQLNLSQNGKVVTIIEPFGTTVLKFDQNANTYQIGKSTLSTFTIGTNSFAFFNPGTDASNILFASNAAFYYGDGQSNSKININIAAGSYQFGHIGAAAANTYLDITAAAGTGNFDFKHAGLSKFNISDTGIKTTQPSANGAGLWQLGKKLAAAVILDAANYIEVSVDGVVYKLAIVN